MTLPLAAQESQNDADMKALESYRLTVPVLNRIAQVQDNMYAVVKAHPALATKYAALSNGDDAKTIDDLARTFDRVPEMKAAVVKAGFTPREYMLATLATFQAAMTSAMLDMPGADPSRLSPNVRANAVFMKSHSAELARMQTRSMELQKLARPTRDAGEPADTSGSLL